MTKYNDVPIVKYDETPIVESNDLIKTDKGGILKRVSYIIFGILPATFFSFTLFVFTIIFAILPIIGTIGLYRITLTEKHNPESTVILLIVGQIRMGFVVGVLLLTAVPWSNFSVSAIFSYIVNDPTDSLFLIIFYLAMLGPIAVALHYQITVYRPWRMKQNKLDKELYMQNLKHSSDVKAD